MAMTLLSQTTFEGRRERLMFGMGSILASSTEIIGGSVDWRTREVLLVMDMREPTLLMALSAMA